MLPLATIFILSRYDAFYQHALHDIFTIIVARSMLRQRFANEPPFVPADRYDPRATLRLITLLFSA